MKTVVPTDSSYRERLRFLLRDFMLYGGAMALSKSSVFITLPLLTRHFSEVDFGILDYMLVLTNFLVIVFIFGQDSAVARYFYEYERNEDRKQLISQSLAFQMTGLIVVLPLLWLGSDGISTWLNISSEATSLLKLSLIQIPSLLALDFSLNLTKWTFARRSYVALSIGFAFSQLAAYSFAVVVLDASIEVVLILNIANSFCFGMFGLFLIRDWLVMPNNLKFLRPLLPFAIPLGFVSVIGAFSGTFERSIIGSAMQAQDLAIYAIASKIAIILGMACSAFQTAWGPFSLSLYQEYGVQKVYNNTLRGFTLVSCILALSLTFMSPLLASFFGSGKYPDAHLLVFPLAMASAIQGIGWIIAIGVGISKRSHFDLYSEALYYSSMFLSALLLIPILGLLGIALGVLVGSIFRSTTAFILAQKVYPLNWELGSTLAMLAITCISGAVASWYSQQGEFSTRSLALVIGILLLILFNFNGLIMKFRVFVAGRISG